MTTIRLTHSSTSTLSIGEFIKSVNSLRSLSMSLITDILLIFSSLYPSLSRITAMDFLNPHDITLLLTGCDDGTVRIWKGYDSLDSYDTKLLSSFQGLSEMIPGELPTRLSFVDYECSGLAYSADLIRF